MMPRTAACQGAVLAVLRDAHGRALPTGQIGDEAGFDGRHGQLVYLVLSRLHKRGLVWRGGGRGTALVSAVWRWLPDESSCDQPWQVPAADPCSTPGGCYRLPQPGTGRVRAGCGECRWWAHVNLGRPGW